MNVRSNAPVDKFKNEYIEMWIENGILFGRYQEGVIVDLKAAEKIWEDRVTFQKGKSYPACIDGSKVSYWTKEARSFHASPHNNLGLTAIAVHIDSTFQKIMVEFYLYFNNPQTPTACFTGKEKALEWLNNYM